MPSYHHLPVKGTGICPICPPAHGFYLSFTFFLSFFRIPRSFETVRCFALFLRKNFIGFPQTRPFPRVSSGAQSIFCNYSIFQLHYLCRNAHALARFFDMPLMFCSFTLFKLHLFHPNAIAFAESFRRVVCALQYYIVRISPDRRSMSAPTRFLRHVARALPVSPAVFGKMPGTRAIYDIMLALFVRPGGRKNEIGR